MDKKIIPSLTKSSSTLSVSLESQVEVVGKRWLILILFALFSLSSGFQWIQYAIVTNVISKYYGVSNIAVNWTSVIFMIVYIPGILPAMHLLDKKGLRYCVLLGSFGNCLGSWIKVLSVDPNLFWVTMTGQTIVAASQLFILSLPPRLAAVWFGPNEVSKATSIGVFGNQVGIALGFVLPPLLFPDANDPVVVSHGLNVMFLSVAVFTSCLFILKVFLFEDKPKFAPSLAQALAIREHEERMNQKDDPATPSKDGVLKSFFTNRNFVLLLVTYGLNVGVFYAISTVLNQLVDVRFPGNEVAAGIMGLIITLSGVFGAILCGAILDSTHKFKETTFIVYIFSLLGMVAFALALRLPVIWPLFVISGILGFFMTGYLPLGFEFAAELSYPLPEGTAAGLLNGSAQICGIIFTFGASAVIDIWKDIPANVFLVCSLLLGTMLTYLVQPDLRRRKAALGPGSNNNEGSVQFS